MSATVNTTAAEIPAWILWTHSAKGDVQNAATLILDAIAMIDAGEHAAARYNVILCGEKLDAAVKSLTQALR